MMRFLFSFVLLLLAFVYVLLACAATPAAYGQSVDVYSRPLQSERSRDFDVLHYRIALRFDEEQKAFYGENTITLTPLKDGFNACVLDAETFTVTSVHGETGSPLPYEQPPHQVRIRFPKSYGYGDRLTFTVCYACENTVADAAAFGMSGGYAIGLTFVEETDNNPRLIQALSFPTGARHWYPCYDHPNDKTTQEVIATVRKGNKVLSNGRLVSIEENGDAETVTYHWSQERPHPTYLSMIVAGPYGVIEDSLGDLPINYWVYEKDLEDGLRSFHKTPEIIAYFNEIFGYPYPWAKCDQITVPGIGGGAECTSATLIGQSTIHDERADMDFPSHWLVAHEAAHQWWGDLVTLRDWGHTWVNEGFGTYYEYRFKCHDSGEDEGALDLLGKKNAYLNEARNRYIRPIVFHRWNAPGENFDRHTYPKAACVIHMMRWILGETPFRKTVSHFLHQHAFQPADTHDFLTAVKEATGQNLDWFFDQWLYKPGHPVFDVGYSWDGDRKEVKMRIAQRQDLSRGVPIFRTPVVIGIVTEDGRWSEKVWLDEKMEEHVFPCGKRPLMVRFDEGNHLLKEWTFLKTTEELLYQLENDDVIGRMWAAAELGRIRDDARVAEALVQCGKGDPFWAVRRDAVHALGGFRNEVHIAFFKGAAEDEHSRVRASALQQLGDYKRPELVTFFKERFEADRSYLAQAEALRSIGKCGDAASIHFLESAREMKSYRNLIRNAANWALGQVQ